MTQEEMIKTIEQLSKKVKKMDELELRCSKLEIEVMLVKMNMQEMMLDLEDK